jgi:hypothetical protein
MEFNETCLHCTELITGRNLTGLFTLSGHEISAKIYSYEKSFLIDPEHPIFLRTEKNDIVSLHSNIGDPPRQSSRVVPPIRTAYRQDIISNIAIIGHDAWTADDRVKRVTFKVSHTNHLLRHHGKFADLGRVDTVGPNAWLIHRDQATGMWLEARYAAVYEMGWFDAPKEVWPVFAIEFDELPTIHEYIQHVSDYTRFLSFCLGAPLTPSEFHISRLSLDEAIAATGNGTYPGDHGVHYVWPETKVDSRDLWVGGSPVTAWDDDELTAFRACLVNWINRAPTWRKSYALMSACLEKKNEITAERLVHACRWLEEIPLAAVRQAISDDDVDAISAAAAQAANSRGLATDIRHRIAGSIKRLKAETTEEQFRRLVKMVQEKFGSNCLSDGVLPHLKRAINLRGKAAHGHYCPDDDAEFRDFCKSITALEALCILLTAYDLPINAEGIRRMNYNPVVRDYRLS